MIVDQFTASLLHLLAGRHGDVDDVFPVAPDIIKANLTDGRVAWITIKIEEEETG